LNLWLQADRQFPSKTVFFGYNEAVLVFADGVSNKDSNFAVGIEFKHGVKKSRNGFC